MSDKIDQNITDKVQAYIAGAKKHMQEVPPSQQADILQNIEAHIYSALADRAGENPTATDLDAVLSVMDPPSSYGAKSSKCLSGIAVSVCAILVIGLILGIVSLLSSEDIVVIDSVEIAGPVTELAEPIEVPVKSESLNNPVSVEPAKPAPRINGKIVVALNPLSSVAGLEGEQTAVSEIMQAELSGSETITLVDRDQMHKTLNELKLGQQGMLSPESARQLGKIVGARYFCSGSIRKSGDKSMATVKIIDVETTLTKLAYTFLKSKDDAVEAGKTLAGQVEDVIVKFEKEKTQRHAKIAQESKSKAKVIPESWKRPTVIVIIREMHVRQPLVIDPAGETEVVKRLLASGFKVVDSEYVNMMKANQGNTASESRTKLKLNEIIRTRRTVKDLKTATEYAARKGADVLLYGEAISERGASLGDFEGCRARIELKAIDVNTDEILAADSAHGGATDLAETVAGKKAIQQAANRLSDTFLYSLAKKWNERK